MLLFFLLVPVYFLLSVIPAAALPGFHLLFSLFIFHADALSSGSPLLFFLLWSPAFAVSGSLYSSYHITPAAALLSLWVPCCWYFFPFTFLYLVTPAAALVFSPLVFFLFLYSLLLCLVPHYSSFSYYPCCCSVFLFPFTFLSLHIPCCSALFPFTLVSFHNPCWCSVVWFPFTLLHLIIPCCCSALFPFNFLYLFIPCCSAVFPFTFLSLHIPCSCSVFLLAFSFLSLINPCCSCVLFPIYSSFSYYPMLQLCIVPHLLFFLFVFLTLLSLNNPCCCPFLFPFTLCSLITPCCCSVLLAFALLSHFILCCSALFPFTFLSFDIPWCCSVFLFSFILFFPFTLLFLFTFLSLCIPCFSVFFPFSCLSYFHAAALSSCSPLLFSSF